MRKNGGSKILLAELHTSLLKISVKSHFSLSLDILDKGEGRLVRTTMESRQGHIIFQVRDDNNCGDRSNKLEFYEVIA